MSTRETSGSGRAADVLATGCAAVGALALGGRSLRGQPARASRRGPIIRSRWGSRAIRCAGYTRDGQPDLPKALAVTKELGLHYWESYTAHVPMTADSEKLAERKRADRGGRCDGDRLRGRPAHQGRDANRQIFEFAKAMGLKYISASPEPGSFDILDKLVEEYDVAVGIHNHGPGPTATPRSTTIAQAIKDHHPKIGCCIDTGHFLRSREDPVHAVEVFGKRVYGVHLKDVKDAETFTILGQGDLRTVDLLKALARNNYEYCLAIEYEEKPGEPARGHQGLPGRSPQGHRRGQQGVSDDAGSRAASLRSAPTPGDATIGLGARREARYTGCDGARSDRWLRGASRDDARGKGWRRRASRGSRDRGPGRRRPDAPGPLVAAGRSLAGPWSSPTASASMGGRTATWPRRSARRSTSTSSRSTSAATAAAPAAAGSSAATTN